MLTESGKKNSGCHALMDFLDAVPQNLHGPLDDSNNLIKGLTTGIDELDYLTTGFRAGALTVIGGRPAMGSTSLALSIAQKISLEQSKTIVIFSLNFDGEEAARRILSRACEMDSLRYRRVVEANNLPPAVALERLRHASIYIDDTANCVPEIRESIQSLIRRGVSPDLVVIDDLQMLADIHSVVRTEAVVRTIRALAQEIGAPIIVTTNLSRRLEKRRDKRPRLSDLPEGVVTGGVDLAMTVFRGEHYSPDTPYKGMTEVCVMRNRYGRLGMLELCFRQNGGL